MDILKRTEIIKGDLTKIKASAIVNAANNSLTGGGGVDGAIHRAAGPELLEECIALKGCGTGEAKITGSWNITTCDYIIHTVGPVYSNRPKDPLLLKSCYINALTIAKQYSLESIAFPAISCGVYGYPVTEASEIAIETCLSFLKEKEFPGRIIFVLFSNEFYEVYSETLNRFKIL